MMNGTDHLTELDGRDLVLTLHPIGHPSHEHTYKASDELGELVRYLVHATLPERAAVALPYPVSVDDLVKNLRYAFEAMPQLLQQVAARLAKFRQDPALATDSPDDGVTAADRAGEAEQLLLALADQIATLTDTWASVRSNTARLKLAGPDLD